MCGVLNSNPIAGMSFDLPENKASNKPQGGQGLSESEWGKVLDWLLSDSWKGALPQSGSVRGKYSRQQLANAQRAIVELTALQAVTGLRIGEARTLTWDKVSKAVTRLKLPTRQARPTEAELSQFSTRASFRYSKIAEPKVVGSDWFSPLPQPIIRGANGTSPTARRLFAPFIVR